MKKKLLLACGLTLALAACSEQHKTETTPAPQPSAAAQTTSTTAPATTQSTDAVAPAQQSVGSTLPESTLPVPAWISQKEKTVAPVWNMMAGGQEFNVVSACKPNDCGSDFMYIATNEATKQAYSLVVNVKDVDGAITEPSKYATYWFVGNPDAQVKALLQKSLQSNPNWK